jgi:hypothetical protein
MAIKLNDRCTNFKIAMAIAEMPIDNAGAEFIMTIFDFLSQKKGDVTVRDIIKIKNKITSKYVMDAQQEQNYHESMNDAEETNDNKKDE